MTYNVSDGFGNVLEVETTLDSLVLTIRSDKYSVEADFVLKDSNSESQTLDDEELSKLFSAIADDEIFLFSHRQLPELDSDAHIPVLGREIHLDDLTVEDVDEMQNLVRLLMSGIVRFRSRRNKQLHFELNRIKSALRNINIDIPDNIIDQFVFDMYQNGIRAVNVEEEKKNDQ